MRRSACVISGLTAILLTSQAQASDYGCRVLLCLANPAGPTAIAQCVPPITQLWRDLARLRPFPTCDEARPAQAVQNTTWYDPCPDGTTALDNGALALQQGAPDTTPPLVGIGTGDSLIPDLVDDVVLGRKVCVGRQVGQVIASIGSGEDLSVQLVNVYDRIAILDPATSPNVIDVYLNDSLYRRVRW